MHDKMVSLVERMLAFAQAESAHAALKDRQEQEMVKREIESTDGVIDMVGL